MKISMKKHIEESSMQKSKLVQVCFSCLYSNVNSSFDLKSTELDMCGWTKFNYAEKFDLNYRPDNCERIQIDQVSPEEFIAKYEMKYYPVVITGVCDDWKTSEKWNPEVSD